MKVKEKSHEENHKGEKWRHKEREREILNAAHELLVEPYTSYMWDFKFAI